jgi:hypothetical protein
MDELEEIPEILSTAVDMSIIPTKNRKSPEKTVVKAKAKQSEKQRLVERYLENFDASKGVSPTHEEVKRLSVSTLKERLKCIEIKQSVSLQPTGLAERVISLVSVLLDTLLQTDSEIQKTNESDLELRRAVQSELGSLATYLNNKVQIASHLALNTGKVVLKKRKLDKDKDGLQDSIEEVHAESN